MDRKPGMVCRVCSRICSNCFCRPSSAMCAEASGVTVTGTLIVLDMAAPAERGRVVPPPLWAEAVPDVHAEREGQSCGTGSGVARSRLLLHRQADEVRNGADGVGRGEVADAAVQVQAELAGQHIVRDA